MHTLRSLGGTVPVGGIALTGVKKLHELEQRVVDDFVIPLARGDLDTLVRHAALLFHYRSQLERCGCTAYFLDLLDFVSKAISLMEENKALRSKMYSDEGVQQLYYQTARVQLLPEYELYNAIVGAPDLREGDRYDMARVNAIKHIVDTTRPEDLNYSLLERLLSSA